jgi:hypothetical protein
MPIQLDIAGNFAKGQQVRNTARLARQIERANDYDLALDEEKLLGRRGAIRQAEEMYGLDPVDFGQFQTNDDPMYMRLANWWRQRRELRRGGRSMQTPPGDYDAIDRMQELQRQQAIPTQGFADGGNVTDVADEDEMIRRRAAAERARNPATVASRTESAIPQRPSLMSRVGSLARRGASLARRGVNVAGKIAALPALVGTAIETRYTPTEDYRRRFGLETNDPSLLGDIGIRTLGAASDLGNILTGSMAGSMYRDKQSAIPASPTDAAKPLDQPEEGPPVPVTPDEAIAQAAKGEGERMVQQATEGTKPPGEIDFSKVNVPPSEIPSMSVKDWVEYRARAVRNAMLQGANPTEAHQQVTQLQMQGFRDYAQQALLHLEGGNPLAAASALRAAYQYFPNGSDVKIGVTKGVDGNPVLVGMGRNEETGESVGSPMVLNSERLSVMIENMANPNAFRAWTKDWRDEQFTRQQYEEVEKPQAQSQMDIAQRNARSYEMMAGAQMMNAERQGAGGAKPRTQSDLDRANAAFVKTVEMLSLTDQAKADRLMSVMSQIYKQSNWEYPQVIEFVREADARGQLDDFAQRLGVQ